MEKYSACEDIYPAVECRDDSENRADIFNILSIDGDVELYIASEVDEELRATKHALWMARALRANDAKSVVVMYEYNAKHLKSQYNNLAHNAGKVWEDHWKWVERKCREKAEIIYGEELMFLANFLIGAKKCLKIILNEKTLH